MPLSVARSQNEVTYMRLGPKPVPQDIESRERALSLPVDMSFTLKAHTLADIGQNKS